MIDDGAKGDPEGGGKIPLTEDIAYWVLVCSGMTLAIILLTAIECTT